MRIDMATWHIQYCWKALEEENISQVGIWVETYSILNLFLSSKISKNKNLETDLSTDQTMMVVATI